MAGPPPEFNPHAFGLAVGKARAALDFTYEQFAELAGVSRRTLINIEQGEGNPRLNNLHGIVHAVQEAGMSLCELWAAVCEGHEPAGSPKSDRANPTAK